MLFLLSSASLALRWGGRAALPPTLNQIITVLNAAWSPELLWPIQRDAYANQIVAQIWQPKIVLKLSK